MRRLMVSILLVAGVAVLVGCTPQTNSTTILNPDGTTTQLESDNNNGEGGAKSANWPSHIPTPNGASNFNYAKADDVYYLSYDWNVDLSVPDAADEVNDLLVSAGWAEDLEGVLETDQASIRNFTRGGDTLLLTVGQEDQGLTVAIIAGPEQE